MTDPDLAAARQRLTNLAQAEGVAIEDMPAGYAQRRALGLEPTPLETALTERDQARDELARHKTLAQEKIETIRADRDTALEDLDEARADLADMHHLVRAAVAAELNNRAHPPIPDPTGHVHAWDYSRNGGICDCGKPPR